MNRRTFLSTAGATAACIAASGLVPSRKLFAQSSLDQTLINNVTDTHAGAIANLYNNIGTMDDFYAMAWANSTLATHFTDTGFDAQFMQTIAGWTPDQIDLSQLDLTAATTIIQNFAPAYQLSDSQSLMSQFPVGPTDVANALGRLQQYGMASYLNSGATALQRMGASIAPPDPLARMYQRPRQNSIRSAAFHPGNKNKPHFMMAAQRPFMQIPSTGTVGSRTAHYSCAQDSMMLMGFTVEATIVGIACWGGVITGFVCSPVLGVVGLVWGAAHTVICGWG
jgi:hypothetical protein